MSRRGKFLRGLRWLLQAQLLFGICLFLAHYALAGPLQKGEDYQTVRDRPVLAPEAIALAKEADGRLYILFEDMAAVNVYDGTGHFLWAVSIPYHDHTGPARMILEEEKLYLYQKGYSVYCYNSADGRFLDRFLLEGHEEKFPVTGESAHRVGEDGVPPGRICFSPRTVYRGGEDGELIPLVSRPWWIKLLYKVTAWLLCFPALFCLFLLQEMGPAFLRRERGQRWRPQDPAAVKLLRRGQFSVGLNLAYAAGNVVDRLFFHTHYLCPGILLVWGYLIFFGLITEDKMRRKGISPGDQIELRAWGGYIWGTAMVAFFSVIVGASG